MLEKKNPIVNNFKDLLAWQVNYELTVRIYRITKIFPSEEKFGIVDQIRRAASSIIANIAEGYGRFYFKDKIVFYYHARASSTEVENFLILSHDLNYIDNKNYTELIDLRERGYQLICGLIRSTGKSVIRKTPIVSRKS